MTKHGLSTSGRSLGSTLQSKAECDIVVVVREQTMVLKCRDYSQAVRWAKIECKSYKIPDDFTVELVAVAEPLSEYVEEPRDC